MKLIPDPETQPTMTVEQAALALGVGRSHAYAQCRLYVATKGAEGDIPTIAVGRKLVCPTVAIRRMVGLDAPELIAS